jgi:hypothetical protein
MAVLELQLLGAVLDPILFDLMALHSAHLQKAHLVILKWREIVSIGRAAALWAVLCLLEFSPPVVLLTLLCQFLNYFPWSR